MVTRANLTIAMAYLFTFHQVISSMYQHVILVSIFCFKDIIVNIQEYYLKGYFKVLTDFRK